MNILVTGANGQLGNELQQIVSHSTHQFFFTDIDQLDITKKDQIKNFIKKHSIELIINCAAYTAVDKAEENEELCDLINHVAPGYLAEAIKSVGGKMIHISTDYVFDGKSFKPLREDDSTLPIAVYGKTKYKGEEAVLKACPDSIIIRTAWLYSEFGNNFVKTMLKLGRTKDCIGVIADQIGTPTYAGDLAKAIIHIISNEFHPGIYHFSNEGVCSWYDFTKAIFEIAEIKKCSVKAIETKDYPTLAERPHYSVLNKAKIKEVYKLEINWWVDSLKDCITKIIQTEQAITSYE